MKPAVFIKAFILSAIISIGIANGQKVNIAVLDIDAVGGKYSPEYFIFRNELSSSNYFDILDVGKIDESLKKQNLKVRSPYELGRILSVEKLVLFSSLKNGSETIYYISGLDITARKKVFDDSIKAETPQQTNLALRICARRSAYRLNSVELTEEIEQQINQELTAEKQRIEAHIEKAAEENKFNRPFIIPAYAATVTGAGLLVAGLVMNSKAAQAINSRNATCDEYCTASTGIDELWDAAISYQEDAKSYIKTRNYAYVSSVVLCAGGIYLYTIKRKKMKTSVTMGLNSVSLVYRF